MTKPFIIYPRMEEEVSEAVEKSDNMDAENAVHYLDGALHLFAKSINWQIQEAHNRKLDPDGWITLDTLARWTRCCQYIRDVRLIAWLEKWYPNAILAPEGNN